MSEEELAERIFQLEKENRKLKEFFTEDIGNNIVLSYDHDIGIFSNIFTKYSEIYYLVNNKKLIPEDEIKVKGLGVD